MKANKYLSLAALAIAFASCTQDDLMPQGNQKDAPLAIATAGVAELATRATIDADNNLVDGSIGVYVTSNKGGRYAAENMQWTYSSSNGWESTGKLSFQNDSEQQKIAAYWPYQADVAGGITVTLPEEQANDDLSNLDYLFAEYAGVATNPVDITMKHLLSKVTVNIDKGTEVGSESITAVKMVNVRNQAVWTPPTGTLSANETIGTSRMVTIDADTYEALAIPYSYEYSDFEIRIITESGREFFTSISGYTLQQSCHYTFNLEMGKDKVEVITVSVKDWTNTPLGEAELGSSEVIPSIDGTEYASLTELQNAVKEKLSQDGVTSVTIDGYLTDEVHTAIISAISEIKNQGAVVNNDLLAGSVIYTVHTSFDEAVTAWEDGTMLALLADVSDYGNNFSITDKAVTFDLNGHKIQFTTTASSAFAVENNGRLTIRDSGENGSAECKYSLVQIFHSTGVFNLEGGTFENTYIESFDGGTINMTGGKVSCDELWAVLIGKNNTVINVSGGVLIGDTAEYCISEGIVNISGAAVLTGGAWGILYNPYAATITGGTFDHDPSGWVAEGYTATQSTDESGNTCWTVSANDTTGE